ncbi:phosphopantetheine-protein transferase [Bacillus pseudomycoides]|uniref:4'-phosphopantetheinyl transferase family protein n=1 Tax=Bacillus TaxID=1386 RepID=UPI00036D1DBB|nr:MULTISPECIES: 4'-phosphopantetheinyl transferase superfamily protein [Bacillus]PDX99222.1 phosphopantetheine-protein transferase [Bacillus pseudomycoides]PEK80736.1 phosphopantetheine-protein transferase [Bacillus pseudomycoides]PEN08120.1 phosphopantetheine-protein transferase [Bacillus pseudomycoides]PGB87537.1 phosphopantetheine-protein transferase [Bacillus pseudomycoides]PGS04535.1 phosphopantetheine-protein transferase [Bacillus pseudomycoides]
MELFAVSLVEDIVYSKKLEELTKNVSQERKNKIFRYKNDNDKRRSLVSELLIRNILIQKGIPNEDISFKYNQYGKPFINHYNDIHFNISHSGKWIVCAFDYQPIGIDVEKITPIDLTIAERFFHKKEVDKLMKLDKARRLRYFYNIWTAKESYVKAIGRGLSIPLDSFCIEFDECYENSRVLFKDEKFFLKLYNIHPLYSLTVCRRTKEFPEKFNFYTETSVVNRFIHKIQ